MTDQFASDKLAYILALFDDVDSKAKYLTELFAGGHQDEALTLCCCYIDGLANLAFQNSDRSSFNFVRMLREYGQQSQLDLISPLGLVRWLEQCNRPKLVALGHKLRTLLAHDLNLLASESVLKERVAQELTPYELSLFDKELWRGSLAFVAYERLRNPFIHKLQGPGAVVVGSLDHTLTEAIHIDFNMLHRALQAGIQHFRAVSVDTGTWFGHDFRHR